MFISCVGCVLCRQKSCDKLITVLQVSYWMHVSNCV